MLNEAKADKISSINDGFRRNLIIGGTVLLTQGVICLEPDRLAELLDAVRKFDNFKRSNDPHSEHDFGAIDQNAVRYFWKIDYFKDGSLAEAVLSVLQSDRVTPHETVGRLIRFGPKWS